MGILLIHFVPIILISFFMVRKISRLSGSQWPMRVFYYLFLGLLYRPFIIATWMISPLWIIVLLAFCYWITIRKVRPAPVPLRVASLFFLLFPIWLIPVVLIFSIVPGSHCERLADVPNLTPVFSFCDAGKEEEAKKYTRDAYHCRSAFFNSAGNLVNIVFGAETNPDMHVMPAINPKTGEVVSSMKTFTVFRGYCNAKLKKCAHLISPKFAIRLWDDHKGEEIETMYFGEDRPRFLSPDVTNDKIIYFATDDSWAGVLNLESGKVEKKIEFPSNSLLTIDNTVKRIVVTYNYFLHNSISYYDKTTEKIKNISIGKAMVWKNLGFLFHVTTNPEKELAYVAAPFECAVYEIDLETGKTSGKIKLPIGIRDLTFDTRRNELYASNFVNGYVYRIKTDGKMKLLEKFYVGRRLRYFNYEKDQDVFLAASANGFYIYQPEGYKKRGER